MGREKGHEMGERQVREERPQFRGVYALGARTRLSRSLTEPDSQMALTAVDCYPFPSSLSPQSHPCPILHRPSTPLGSFIPSPSLCLHFAHPRPPFTLSRCSTFASVLQYSEEAALGPERFCLLCTSLRATYLDARQTSEAEELASLMTSSLRAGRLVQDATPQ